MTGADVFIAGSIGPLGDVELRPESRAELFAEQASILEGRGADVFMVETFYDLEELEEAIAAVRSVSSLPIVALMTFDEEGQTLAASRRDRPGRVSPSSASRPRVRTTAQAPRARWRRCRRCSTTGSSSPRCRTSASRASPGRESSTRTRRRSTSRSSPRRRAGSARA